MSWWEIIPAVVAAILVLVLPGLGFSLAARVRGLSAVLLAPVFTVAMAGVSSLILPLVRIPWGPPSFAAASGGLIVTAFAVRLWMARRWPDAERAPGRRSATVSAMAGLALAAVLIIPMMAAAVGQPENISQTYDNVFHLNAVKWALESGNASPLNLGAFTGISAYPAAWHALVALVASLTGVTVPAAITATNLVVGGVAWPLSCMFFVQMTSGVRVATNVLAGLFAAGFSAFPMLMIDWGVLYPNLLSIAILPAALGLGVSALGLGRLHRPCSPAAWILFLVAIPAVALAHPSTLMALLVFLLPAFLAIYWFRLRAQLPAESPERRMKILGLTALLAAGLLLLAVLWRIFRPPAGSADWAPVESSAQVVGEILLSAPMGRPAALIVGACLIVGLVRLFLTGSRRWLLGLFLVASIFFFYAAGLNVSPRWFLTGVWYYDSFRLAALMPTATLPLAVIGGVSLWDSARRWCGVRLQQDDRLGRVLGSIAASQPARAVLHGVGGIVLVVGTQFGITTFAAEQAHYRYMGGNDAPLLSRDEQKLLGRLGQHVAPNEVIAGMPSNGSALAFALGGRDVLQPHILTTHGSDVDLVNAGLKVADRVPEVCPAIRDLNVHWVLDFGTRGVTGTLPGYGGVLDLRESAAVALVDSEGEARLYRVTACWG